MPRIYGTVCSSPVSQNAGYPPAEARYSANGTRNARPPNSRSTSMQVRQRFQQPFQPRVIVAESFVRDGMEVLRGGGVEIVDAVGRPRAALLELLESADALIVRSETRVDEELLAAGPRLAVVGRAGVGVDAIDLAAATRRGIVVLNTPGGNTLAATEQTFALMLNLMRHTTTAHQRLQRGEWSRRDLVGTELAGKTLGIVGIGRVGSNVASRARAFGMRVLAYDPFVSQARAEALGAKLVDLETLLRSADIVTLHAPRTAQTQDMIGVRELALMRRGTRLVNCARGGLVVEEALLDALDSGHLAGAAIDVVREEPPPAGGAARRLQAHPKTVATPHLGGSTHEALARIATELAKDVLAVLDGRPPMAAVNAPIVPDEAARPFVDLASILGGLYPQFVERATLPSFSLTLEGELARYEPEPFVAAFLVGLLQHVTDRRVTTVNARAIAAELGIAVEVLVAKCERGFASSLAMRGGDLSLAGTVVHGEQPRLVEIAGYDVDVEPRGALLATRHHDVPGIVGKVGTVLGAAGINISHMQVARNGEGHAIMVMGVGAVPDAGVLDQLRGLEGLEAVRCIVIDR
ncbi:phosphoglycerate dehydrogenase [bacterium]|nr:MAG: phosphoglycerate dehydrogenase [bacterium]